MKIALIPFLLLFLFPFLSVSQLSGTYKIGTPVASACGGACDYGSITLVGGAFEALNFNGINGNVVFEIYTNLPGETGANALGSITDLGGPHTVTFRPNTNAARLISGTNNTGGLIALADADRVIFDGRATVDQTLSLTNRHLTIRNSGTASTVTISSDAVSCSFRALIIEGRNVNTTGVVNVSGGGTAGNDDLNIDYCDIKSDGANLPLRGIVLEGGSSQNNDNVQITNNRIFDFFVATGVNAGGTGIYIGNFNSNILIAGNSIYQTANRTAAVNVSYQCISINSPAGSGFNILNNFLGGSAEGAVGTPRTISATGNQYVRAKLIDITETGFATPSLISGNTIRGMSTSSTASTGATQAMLASIFVIRGYVNVRNNTIGGTTANSRLSVTANATSAACAYRNYGIVFDSETSGAGIRGDIDGNSIDNLFLTTSGATASTGSTMAGILITIETGTDAVSVRKNIIGNITGTVRFTTGTAVPPGNITVNGISVNRNVVPVEVDRNKIANLSNQVGGSGLIAMHAIVLNTPANTIHTTRNQIFNISSAATNGTNASGIYTFDVGAQTCVVAKNIIHGISSAAGSVCVGIIIELPPSTPVVSRIENNMIALTQSPGAGVLGITTSGGAGAVAVFANSVVISGAATGGFVTSAYYKFTTHTGLTQFRANIFLNSSTGGSGVHCALTCESTFSGITSNHNLLFSASAANTTRVGSTSSTFAQWQANTGQDANSRNADVTAKFISIANGNLRIPDDGTALVTNNIVNRGAANVAGNPVTDDVDNAHRINITDIGASEVGLVWSGNTSTAWQTAANWYGNIIPTCGGRELIKISAGTTFQPIISAATPAVFKELVILEDAVVTLSGSGQLNQCAAGVSPFSLIVNGTLTVAGAQPIRLYGDFYQNNVFNRGTGSLILEAATAQALDGDAAVIDLHNLTINGGGTKTAAQRVKVFNALTFTNGLVNTSTGRELIFGTAGTHTGASATSHVTGPVSKETNSTTQFYFPVGKSGKYRPASITPSNTLASTYTTEYFNQSAVDNIGSAMAPGVVSVSDVEYWRMNRIGSANGQISLTWDADSYVSADQDDRDLLGVVRWNGNQWSNHYQTSNTGTQASGEVLSQFVGVFDTYFTLGSSTTNNPLPIELLYFRAALAEGMVRAEWATEMEESFDRFELEKASSDLVFTKIGEVKSLATGEPWKLRTYSHIDETPYIGDNYYRLKAIDLDGTFQYYNVVRVFNPGEGTLNVYPNPIRSTEVLTVKVDFTPTPQDKVILMNLQGTEVQHTAITGGGVNEITLGNNVKPGLYLLRYTSPAFQKTFKVVVR